MSFTWPWPGRWRPSSATETELATDRPPIASHYAAAGDQPAALRSTVSAATAADAGHGPRRGRRAAERALELWPRVAEPESPGRLRPRRAALPRRPRALVLGRPRAQRGPAAGRRSRELDSDRDPARYATLLARLARTIWSLNRGAEAVATGERALALLPTDDPLGARPALMAWLARTKFLRGRFRQAAADGEAALAGGRRCRRRAGPRPRCSTRWAWPRSRLGELGGGRRPASGARSSSPAATMTRQHAHRLLQPGRHAQLSAGAPTRRWQVALEGLAATPRRLVLSHDWMTLTVSELAFSAGDWAHGARRIWALRRRGWPAWC